MFCNEGDRPYQLSATYEGVAMMARVVAEVAPRDRPFGVDYLWDAQAALSVATATGASFIREVATGVYESDMGLWAPDAAKLLRRRRELSAEHVAVFMNITPEFASTLGTRDIAKTARSVSVSSLRRRDPRVRADGRRRAVARCGARCEERLPPRRRCSRTPA